MQKNIKIKMILSRITFFIFVFIFFQEGIFADELYKDEKIENKKDNDLEFLPGEEIKTNSGRKMRVWSSKGSFHLGKKVEDIDNEKNIDLDTVVIDKRRFEKKEKK